MTGEQHDAWAALAIKYQRPGDDRLTPDQYVWQILWRMGGDAGLWHQVQFKPRRLVVAKMLYGDRLPPDDKTMRATLGAAT